MKNPSLLLICFFIGFSCKEKVPIEPSHVDLQTNSPVASSIAQQCYGGGAVNLNLIESYPNPIISNLSFSKNFPVKVNFNSDQIYDHSEFTICTINKKCINSYSISNPALIFPDNDGSYIVKFRVCYTTACSKDTLFNINFANLTEVQKTIADRINTIDVHLLNLATKRMKMDTSLQLTPYVYLQTFENLFFNQPKRLDLAYSQCPSMFSSTSGTQLHTDTSSQFVEIYTNAETENKITTSTNLNSDSETSTSVQTNSTLKDLKSDLKYFGAASLIFSSIIFGYDVYKIIGVNKEMITKIQMFNDVIKVLNDPKIVEELSIGKFESAISQLESIKNNPKNLKYFSQDIPEEVLKQLQRLQDLHKEITTIESGSLSSKQRYAAIESIQKIIEREQGIMGEYQSKLTVKQPKLPDTFKGQIKQYGGGIGKFLGGLIISGGAFAVGYSLVDNAEVLLKKIDAEMYALFYEKRYLLQQL